MKLSKERVILLVTLLVSFTLLLLSLSKNLFYITGMKESLGSFGLTSFLLGWMNLFGAGICWLANPFLIISWVSLLIGRKKRALLFSGLAMFFSALFLCMKNILINEGGGHGEIIAYDIGYWLWLGSCASNFIGNLILYIKTDNEDC